MESIEITVDAKPEAVSFYEGHGFGPVTAREGESPARPKPSAMFLSIRQIEEALEKS